MTDDGPTSEELEKWHKTFAANLFNHTWDLIDKTQRTPADDAAMLEAAMASRFHWGQVGGPEQHATSDWQIAHVASLLGFGFLAMTYASRALEISEREGWDGWRKASMLEGMARAAAASGDAALRNKYYSLAKTAVAAIKEDEDRELIASQLATVPEI